MGVIADPFASFAEAMGAFFLPVLHNHFRSET